jgi:hypothetical protein
MNEKRYTGDKKYAHKDGQNEVLVPLKIDIDMSGSPPVGSFPRAGSPCPQCRRGVLDYDGLLNLSCDECGYSLAGCFS